MENIVEVPKEIVDLMFKLSNQDKIVPGTILQPGLSLFELEPNTMNVVPVVIIRNNGKSTIDYKCNCIYLKALNLKNANKHADKLLRAAIYSHHHLHTSSLSGTDANQS